MINYVMLALFSPLAGFIIAGIFSNSKKSIALSIFCSALTGLSALCSLILLCYVKKHGAFEITLFEFMNAGDFKSSYAVLIDQLSVMMMLTVGIVATVVHIYSIGYMEHDKSFNKFFSYLGIFVFSMLILVMSDNFIGLFIGWEGVGLSSWLLIGFWYDRPRVSWCANEAFIMNRVADLGLLIGIFLIFINVGSLKYSIVFANVDSINLVILSLIGIFLFIGAMGKSAQFPFHTWLADAMAGPTPVSALIHAATMVTAGVYLVIRAHPIYAQLPGVTHFITYLGAFVAIFAASMAIVCDDLKKNIAYSTLSQLGYMFVAAGLGAYYIALFHLVMHAFFKSLMFLTAGNVMHAMHDELDIKKMGGLRKDLKQTFILMTIAALALCGVFPFAGFFSKDAILESAFASHFYIVWILLLIGAILTTFYSFRLIYFVFLGEKRFHSHPHEAHKFMNIALIPLAILAVIGGFFEHAFVKFMKKLLPNFEHHIGGGTVAFLIILTSLLVIGTIVATLYIYSKNLFDKEKVESCPMHRILKNEYFIPAFYKNVVLVRYYNIANWCANFDKQYIDAFVDFISVVLNKLAGVGEKEQSANLSGMIKYMFAGFLFLLVLIAIF